METHAPREARRFGGFGAAAGALPACKPEHAETYGRQGYGNWIRLLSHDGTSVFVADAGAKIVATCMLITAPNLMRGGRLHAFIENVVTHADYRRQGYGRAVIEAALAAAWAADCYHVLLQSGRKDPGVHRFYENCGFVPGVRTDYVARRPSASSWFYAPYLLNLPITVSPNSRMKRSLSGKCTLIQKCVAPASAAVSILRMQSSTVP